MSTVFCQYGSVDLGIDTLQGCSLTRSKAAQKEVHYSCSVCLKDIDHAKCPIYKDRGGGEK